MITATMQEFIFKHSAYAFSCKLEWARRKSIVFQVMPDCSLLIKAPHKTRLDWLHELILKKAAWIDRQQAIMRARQQLHANRYTDQSSCYFLGKAYTLEIDNNANESIVVEADKIKLYCSHTNRVPAVLKTWYTRQAEGLFAERLKTCQMAIAHLDLPQPKSIKIRSLKSRWGSCSSGGNISLNLELIQYPLACIDYVIFHELCHLRELNHGPNFYALMNKAMQDWQYHRQHLRSLHRLMPGVG